MKNTPDNFSIGQLIAEAQEVRPKNRLFRIYAHSPSLFELLLLLEKQLSEDTDFSHTTPDNATWNDVLKNIQSLCRFEQNALQRPQVLFYLGQIALLLDCIKSRDAYANKPNLVRFFE